MSEKPIRKARPAIIFGQKCEKNVGYIDDYIFACEIVGGDHITYSKPRRAKYHLVILVLDGTLRIIINGNEHIFTKNTYVNLPTWADIYEIEYDDDFKAMTTATDKAVVEDIFRNRNPLPPDFRMKLNHSYGGDILAEDDVILKHIFSFLIAEGDNTDKQGAKSIEILALNLEVSLVD